MSKVYFACSIRGGREDAAHYGEIVEIIKKHATVLTEIFADKTLTTNGMNAPSVEIWTKDMDWVRQADMLIAEVTNPSLGVGYEIANAEIMNKPVLCLYRPSEGRKLSAMIDGSPRSVVVEYIDIASAEQAIVNFIKSSHATIGTL